MGKPRVTGSRSERMGSAGNKNRASMPGRCLAEQFWRLETTYESFPEG